MQLPQYRDEVDVLEDVLGDHLVEGRVGERQRKAAEVVHDVDARQGRDVEVDVACPDVGPAAEVQAPCHARTADGGRGSGPGRATSQTLRRTTGSHAAARSGAGRRLAFVRADTTD